MTSPVVIIQASSSRCSVFLIMMKSQDRMFFQWRPSIHRAVDAEYRRLRSSRGSGRDGGFCRWQWMANGVLLQRKIHDLPQLRVGAPREFVHTRIRMILRQQDEADDGFPILHVHGD